MRKHFPDVSGPDSDSDADANPDADANTNSDADTHADANPDADSDAVAWSNVSVVQHRPQSGPVDERRHRWL